jgi:hypothetical protein
MRARTAIVMMTRQLEEGMGVRHISTAATGSREMQQANRDQSSKQRAQGSNRLDRRWVHHWRRVIHSPAPAGARPKQRDKYHTKSKPREDSSTDVTTVGYG